MLPVVSVPPERRIPMTDTFASLIARSALLGFEAQQVMALRLFRIAAGGALAGREVRRMVTEKAEVAIEAGLAASALIAGGSSGDAALLGAIGAYRKRVRRNRARLTRR